MAGTWVTWVCIIHCRILAYGHDANEKTGSILIAFFAIITCAFLIFLSDKKRAAVGRRLVMVLTFGRGLRKTDLSREIQFFLLGYAIISLCEIFTVGAFPIGDDVRKVRLTQTLYCWLNSHFF